MNDSVRYFKAVMPNGDLIGLFKTNSGIMLLSQTQNIERQFKGIVVELKKHEYDALLNMSKETEQVIN